MCKSQQPREQASVVRWVPWCSVVAHPDQDPDGQVISILKALVAETCPNSCASSIHVAMARPLTIARQAPLSVEFFRQE